MLFVHMPSSPIPIPTMKIAVDSPMVMRNSRHAITEAGFDTIIDNLQKARGNGDEGTAGPDSLEYKGDRDASGPRRAGSSLRANDAFGRNLERLSRFPYSAASVGVSRGFPWRAHRTLHLP